ncbi:hypothetical protein Landi51_03335 [Colletotrichum acutatum]
MEKLRRSEMMALAAANGTWTQWTPEPYMRRPDDMTHLLERQYIATELKSGTKQALEMPCFIGSCGGNIQHPNAQSTVCPTAFEVRSNNKGHNNDTANGSRRVQKATPSPRPKGRQVSALNYRCLEQDDTDELWGSGGGALSDWQDFESGHSAPGDLERTDDLRPHARGCAGVQERFENSQHRHGEKSTTEYRIHIDETS